MFEYELLLFFVGAPIWNLPVIIGSVVGLSQAKKGKSPIASFLIGIVIFLIPVWGNYLGNKRRNAGYLFSEQVIFAIVFCIIYLCITLSIAIKRYHRYNNDMVFYCLSCNDDFNGDARDEPKDHFKCPRCGAPLVNTSILSAEWERLTPPQKEEVLQRFTKSAEDKPKGDEPAKRELVDTLSMETAPVERSFSVTEPVERDFVESEPEDCQINCAGSSNADEIRKYKKLMDEGIITLEEYEAKKKQLLGL